MYSRRSPYTFLGILIMLLGITVFAIKTSANVGAKFNDSNTYEKNTQYIVPAVDRAPNNQVIDTLIQHVYDDAESVKEESQEAIQEESNTVENSVETVENSELAESNIEDPVVEETSSEDETYYMYMSEADTYELATLVYLEAGIESFECQKGIASVVINRMTTTDSTLQEVIYAKNQFSPASLIPYNEPTESTLQAVREVLKDGPIFPEYVTFFRANYYHDFSQYVEPYTQIDHTYFSADTTLK